MTAQPLSRRTKGLWTFPLALAPLPAWIGHEDGAEESLHSTPALAFTPMFASTLSTAAMLLQIRRRCAAQPRRSGRSPGVPSPQPQSIRAFPARAVLWQRLALRGVPLCHPLSRRSLQDGSSSPPPPLLHQGGQPLIGFFTAKSGRRQWSTALQPFLCTLPPHCEGFF